MHLKSVHFYQRHRLDLNNTPPPLQHLLICIISYLFCHFLLENLE